MGLVAFNVDLGKIGPFEMRTGGLELDRESLQIPIGIRLGASDVTAGGVAEHADELGGAVRKRNRSLMKLGSGVVEGEIAAQQLGMHWIGLERADVELATRR